MTGIYWKHTEHLKTPGSKQVNQTHSGLGPGPTHSSQSGRGVNSITAPTRCPCSAYRPPVSSWARPTDWLRALCISQLRARPCSQTIAAIFPLGTRPQPPAGTRDPISGQEHRVKEYNSASVQEGQSEGACGPARNPKSAALVSP